MQTAIDTSTLVYRGMQLRSPADILTVIESLEADKQRLAQELDEERTQRQRFERALVNERNRSRNKLIDIRRMFTRLAREVELKIGAEEGQM